MSPTTLSRRMSSVSRRIYPFLLLLVMTFIAQTQGADTPPSSSRSLRGGSSSGTSYNDDAVDHFTDDDDYHNNNNRIQRIDSSGYLYKILGGLALAIISVTLVFTLCPSFGTSFVAGCLTPLLIALHLKSEDYEERKLELSPSGQPMTEDEFLERCEKAKLLIPVPNKPPVTLPLPHSGDYRTTYMDRGIARTSILKLEFNYVGNGFRISGEGRDLDGRTVIEEGYSNFQGVAWWREQIIADDVCLHVFSTGTFDFQAHRFEGIWYTNTREKGVYRDFRASNPPSRTSAKKPAVTTISFSANLPMNTRRASVPKDFQPGIIDDSVIEEENIYDEYIPPDVTTTMVPLKGDESDELPRSYRPFDNTTYAPPTLDNLQPSGRDRTASHSTSSTVSALSSDVPTNVPGTDISVLSVIPPIVTTGSSQSKAKQ